MSRPGGNTFWPTRRDLTGCYVKVASHNEDRIDVSFPLGDGHVQSMFIDRAEARLLAKRINECLDATVKR